MIKAQAGWCRSCRCGVAGHKLCAYAVAAQISVPWYDRGQQRQGKHEDTILVDLVDTVFM